VYGDIIQDLREGLAVSAEYDDSIRRGIEQAARQLLKIYNFPKSIVRVSLPIGAALDAVDLPADMGKIKGVLLTTFENGVKMYKELHRRGQAQLPTVMGPNFWQQTGSQLVLDQPMPAILATPYNLELWYQSIGAAENEIWLSVDYQDALEHLAGMKLALKRRKKEAADIYGSLWQQDTKILATFVSELEFSLMDIGMGELIGDTPAVDRYPIQ
jgi:hypothetical protein